MTRCVSGRTFMPHTGSVFGAPTGISFGAEVCIAGELVLGVGIGLVFRVAWPLLYPAMGGRGAIGRLGQAYALRLFAGAFATWLHNGLASIHAGSGNMRLPAACLVGNALSHVVL